MTATQRENPTRPPESAAAPGDSVASSHDQPAPLLIHNLLNDFAGLMPLLLDELRRESWLNAYLLAAGLHQILEDYLHPDPYALGKVAHYLSRLRGPLGPLAAGAARLAGGAAWQVHAHAVPTRRLLRQRVVVDDLVQRLAGVVAGQRPLAAPARTHMIASAQALVASLERCPPRLRRDVLRLPSCFRSFDQRPADIERICAAFAQRWPDRSRPVLVVGVRTSGSYLAPLHAACLKANGYQNVRALTMRPGRRWLARDRATLQSVTRAGGLVLLTDDPPSSGGSLATAAEHLKQFGVPHDAIVLCLQLFGARETLPAALRTFASVLLPWEEWSIHEELEPRAVQAALAGMVEATARVRAVERLPLPPRTFVRSHVRALYRAHLVDRDGCPSEQPVYVRGVGLGYLGEHALAVAQPLRDYVPRIYGLRAGLLYRAWLPGERCLSSIEPGEEEAVAAALAAYVLARHHALAVGEDVSPRLANRDAAWQRAGDVLRQGFGRSGVLVRPVLHRAARRLLRVEHPSVVDGSMAPSRWFAAGAGGGLVKVDADERAFCNLDLYCYDPIFDLAGAAAACEGGELAGHLRWAYERLTAKPVDAERWLLYQVLHLREQQRHRAGEQPRVQRALSRVYQRYLAEALCGDVATPISGPLCAIDIDGVLETGRLGFTATSPAGALTLRALARHGFRLVLATGRSLDEVRERCSAYRLAGGVAEYGAVIYNHGTRRVTELLSDGDRAGLERLRAVLRQMDGVRVDADYGRAVRAYRLNREGHRRGLRPETIAAALDEVGLQGRVRPISGMDQTDFMVAGIDKAAGLRALAADLRVTARTDGKLLALAVGDTASDLPMFELAALAGAPANADAAVQRAGVPVMKRPYQAGLALAASALLGHRPGGCPTCRATRPSPEADLLLTALAAQDAGRWGKLKQALLLSAKVVRS